MSTASDTRLPLYASLALARTGRLLTITLNRPDTLNAVDSDMHEELASVFHFAATDAHSDVVVLTGAGRAFSAGGDLQKIAHNAAHPDLFDNDVRHAKRIVSAMLDLDKPLICRMNGHAVGLGATLALFCDVIFAADTAKIGDPHVALGLVAGDGGAAIWPQRIGFGTPKITASTVAGDSIISGGDNSGAIAFQNVMNADRNFPGAGGISAQRESLSDYAASFYQQVSTLSNAVTQNQTTQDDRLQEAQSRMASNSGVSLDEELTNLTTYQQAYTAGARMLTVVDQLYQTLLQIQ